jgi:hypothetical protein
MVLSYLFLFGLLVACIYFIIAMIKSVKQDLK